MDRLRGIEPWEVMQVLTGKRPRWPRRGRDGTGASILTIWGRTNAGRALKVGVYQVSDWQWHIASARELTAVESAEFQQWEETRR
nr:hypothetical protein [Nocardia bovistercoris]